MSEPRGIFFSSSATKELIQGFSNEEIGDVFCAIVNYVDDGILPTFEDRAIQCLFRSLRSQVDGYNRRYQERCEKNKANIAKRWKKKDTTEYDGIRPNTSDTKDTTVYEGESRIPYNRIEQNRIEQNRIEQNRIEQNRIEQNRIEQNRIEHGGKEKEKEKKTSPTSMLEDESWSEAIMLKHHITREQLVAYLSDFDLDQRCRGGTEHDSERDLKQHFASWLMIRRKNEREEKAKNRNPLGLYDSQEKDYKAGGW